LSVTASVSASGSTLDETSNDSETFTISVSGVPSGGWAYAYYTVTGDATLGSYGGDYTQSSDYDQDWSYSSPYQTMMFSGDGSETHTIEPEADIEYEGDETITVTITGGAWCDGQGGYGEIAGGSSATMTIDDDDEWTIVVETTDGKEEAAEGDPCVDGEFVVKRVAVGNSPMDYSYDIEVPYEFYSPTNNDSAAGVWYATEGTGEGTDFQTTISSGTITLPSGSGNETVTVPVDVRDDQTAECKETVLLHLTGDGEACDSCCYTQSYPVTNAKATVTINDNDWVIEAVDDAFEPMKLADAPDSENVEEVGSPGKFRVYLLPGNDNPSETEVGIEISMTTSGNGESDAQGLDDDSYPDEGDIENDKADADGYAADEGGTIIDPDDSSAELTILATATTYAVNVFPWYDKYSNDDGEEVTATISGSNVDTLRNSATLKILEPTLDPQNCTSCCFAGASSSYSDGVIESCNGSTGGAGLSDAGTDLTYFSQYASGQETVVAYQPLDLTNGTATLDLVEAKLTAFGSASPNTAIWFDGSEAEAGETYAFSLPADVSSLSTGAYDWTVQLTQHYSDTSTQVVSVTGDKNVISTLDSDMASGWFPHGVSSLVADGSDVLLMQSGLQRFEPAGSGGWIAQNFRDTNAYTLTGSWSTGFTLTAKNGTEDEFNTSGQLTSTTDPDGNETTYSYSSGKLASMTEPGVRTTTFSYDQQTGYLSSITKPDGVTSTYTVNASGEITAITKPDPDGTGPLSAPVTSLTYDTNGMLATVTSPGGGVESYEYDHALRLEKVTHADDSEDTYVSVFAAALVDTSGGVGTQQNPADLVAATDIDVSSTVGGVTTSADVDGWGLPTNAVNGEGQTTRYLRNAKGQTLKTIEPDPDDDGPLTSSITTYDYDGNGNPIQTTLSDGSSRQWEYDEQWNAVTKYVDELGNVTLYAVDADTGNVASQTIIVGELDGFGNTETDDLVTSYTYTDSNDNTLIGSGGPDSLHDWGSF